MDKFVKKEATENKVYFEEAAGKLDPPANIIEKDLWVCWTLKRIFEMDEVREQINFKGGTSLSKVYNVIHRFSEDIDFCISREYLGYGGENDPTEKESNTKKETALKALNKACEDFVSGKFLTKLNETVESHLGEDGWKIVIDDENKSNLLFHYPSSGIEASEYVPPVVRIEFSAKSDQFPVEDKIINAYVAQAFPEILKDNEVKISVLKLKRTFWEKATILHFYANYPEGKTVRIRQSRHYYDFYCLLKSEYKKEASEDVELLKAVANHKYVYTPTGWAKYEEAIKGTLKLVPSTEVSEFMQKDYATMDEMFFKTPPAWNEIIETISKFEKEFNEI